MAGAAILVLTQMPDRASAQALARALVEARLAACVSVGAPVESLYHWRGEIETAQEVPVVGQDAAPSATPRSRRRSGRGIPTNFRKSSLSRFFDGLRTLSRLDRRAKPRRPDRLGGPGGRAASRGGGADRGVDPGGRGRPQPKLLEPERAFAFSVQALDDRTLEARFAIADGYYLYRDKLKIQRRAAGRWPPPRCCPPGKIKDDEFFGRVETYRGRLAVRLSLDSGAPGRKVTVRAESQGCADVGVCYPPQVQNVTLTLPGAGRGPGSAGRGDARPKVLVQLTRACAGPAPEHPAVSTHYSECNMLRHLDH